MIEYSRPGPDVRTAIERRSIGFALVADVVMIVAGGGAAFLLIGGITQVLAPVPAYAAPMAAILVMVALNHLIRNVSRRRVALATDYLEQAVRLRLPLPAALRAAAASERGATRYRLNDFADWLERGVAVDVAFQQAFPRAPQRLIGLIAAGERLGRLTDVLARITRRQRLTRQRTDRQIFLSWYPLSMLLMVALVGTGVNLLIVPRLRRMATDFHLKLPPVSQFVIDFFDTVQIPLLIVAGLLVAIYAGRFLRRALPRRKPLPDPWKALTDRIVWRTPVAGATVRSRNLADVCHVMADAVSAGQPFDRALADATLAADNVVLRNRMWAWAQRVSRGEPPASAAAAVRMPRLVSGLLQTARGPGGAAQALDFLAGYYDNRFNAAAELLQAAAIPALVLVFGFLVGSLALGIFQPLAEMASHMGSAKGGL